MFPKVIISDSLQSASIRLKSFSSLMGQPSALIERKGWGPKHTASKQQTRPKPPSSQPSTLVSSRLSSRLLPFTFSNAGYVLN